MLNKRLLVLCAALCLSGFCSANAKLDLNDLTYPKDPAYRVGISEIPENQYVEAKDDLQSDKSELTADDTSDSTDVSYADLTLKKLSREISRSLIYEENDMVADLTLLWQGAAMQSDTINFALYKLANPDADKPQKSTVKSMLKTIASMSTLAGATMANPLLAGTSLIGGDFLNIMSQDTKALNYKYTKVSDADMIILIRKVEDLQQNAVNLYYDYMNAKKQLELASDVLKERKHRFETAQKKNAARELVVVTDAYYRTALDRHKTARSEFLSKRAALEQFVGNEAFTQFEKELAQREAGFKTAENSEEYEQTVQNVEDYTANLEQEQANEGENDLIAKREDQYDTKGLIFLHNERQNEEAEQQTTDVSEEASADKGKKKKKSKNKKQKASKEPSIEVDFATPNPHEALPKDKKFQGMELLPLEEIKAPNFYKNGSIFTESN